MNTDRYTNVVLTVIAICLIWLCINGLTPTVTAQTEPQPQRVVVVGWERALPVVVVDDKGVPLIGAEGLRVNLGGEVLPVALRAIQKSDMWSPIAVDVMKSPPTLLPGP